MKSSASSQFTILVPNGNIAPSLNVILLLKKEKKLNLRIICSDSLNLAPGHYFADKSYFVEFHNKPRYFTEIEKICLLEKVKLILPTRPIDNILFSGLRHKFKRLGIIIPVSEPKSISICIDKSRLYTFLSKNEIKIPKIYDSSRNLPGNRQCVLKPRISSGSKDISFVKPTEINKIPKTHLLQEYIAGREYTIDCLISKTGRLMAYVIRERIRVMQGMSIQSLTLKNQQILLILEKIFKKIKLWGLINVQFLEDENKKIYLNDINIAPAAGGLMLSEKAGVNLPVLLVKEAVGIKFPKKDTEYKKNIYMTRYFQEIFYQKINNKLRPLE